MKPSEVAAYVACALIWGTTWFAIRVCIADYPTLDAAALRFAIAAALLVPLAWRMRPWPRMPWGFLVMAGALNAATYLLVYYGEEHVVGGIAAVVYGTQPLILAVLLRVVRIERLTRDHLLGAVISLGGVTVLFLDRLDVSAKQALGIALLVGSVIGSTVYSMVMKKRAAGVPNLVAVAVFMAVTAIVLVAAAIAKGEPVPWPPPVAATGALLYLAVLGSVVAFLVYFWLLGRTSLQVTSTLVFLYPLVALVVDAMFEPQHDLTARAYLGAAITLGGLAVSLRGRLARAT
jgi:drug/metabolite transporter (DMT)-like permease